MKIGGVTPSGGLALAGLTIGLLILLIALFPQLGILLQNIGANK